MLERNYIITNERLMKFWDKQNNCKSSYFPEKVTCGSNDKPWWICEKCGKSYQQSPKDKLKSQYDVCSDCLKYYARLNNIKTRLIKGESLADKFPELLNEWVDCEIKELTAWDVMPQSNLSVNWKCPKCFGIYPATITNRTKMNSGCPYCSGQKVLKGYNDLETKNPQLAKEWSDKNICLPSQFTIKSNEKVLWKCNFGHEDYTSSIKQRSNGQGCPKCASELQTSFPEQAIFYYIKKIYKSAINRYKYNDKYEIDIFIPELNIGIEYNGYFYHKDKLHKDNEKIAKLQEYGIKIFTVNEIKNGKIINDANFYINCSYKSNEFNNLVKSILKSLDDRSKLDIDIDRDRIQIHEQYISLVKENSIAYKAPHLVSEWDYNNNGKIKPEFVSYGSSVRYYWICPICQNSYKASPKNRFNGTRCPICSGKQVIKTTNDLATLHPNLLQEWDYEKNNQHPSEIYGGGKTLYNWICKLGHSYKCSIQNKLKGYGCSICSGKQVLKGFNDLESQQPEIALDWDLSKNKISPDKVHFNSFKEYNWKCHICGHEWKYQIASRNKCSDCVAKSKIINVYDTTGNFVGSYFGLENLCINFGLNYKKQHGNISSVCVRVQKTLLSKYICRYDKDDEFINLSESQRRLAICEYLKDYKSNQPRNINVYDIIDYICLGTFNGLKIISEKFNIKTKSNINSVCKRIQKSISSRYIMRYEDDDEFMDLVGLNLKNKIDKFLNR